MNVTITTIPEYGGIPTAWTPDGAGHRKHRSRPARNPARRHRTPFPQAPVPPGQALRF